MLGELDRIDLYCTIVRGESVTCTRIAYARRDIQFVFAPVSLPT